MTNVREAALKSAEDCLFRVRESFETADRLRLSGSWVSERAFVQTTREAIDQTIANLTTLRGLL